MKVITYRITLLEPALVTALQGDPNSAVAFNYLPGSVLRGLMIGNYLRQNKRQGDLDPADPDTARLFFSGATRYLNGYPLDRADQRALPVPRSWQTEKDDELNITDFAIEPGDPAKQWQPVRWPFCRLDEDRAYPVRGERQVAVHTQRTPRFGRAMPEHRLVRDELGKETRVPLLEPDDILGAVYRYDALAAGQTFEAAIICEDEADVATLLPLLDGQVTLGGSRSGGYGRAELRCVGEPQSEWREAPADLDRRPDEILIVTLLSDALLRDTNGQYAAEPTVVAAALGAGIGTLQSAFMDATAIGGFNRKWGLPLPQTLALRMGSVFVFAASSYNQGQLDQLAERGIGERRAEGFGRVAFNWHTQETLTVETDTSPRSVKPSPLADGTAAAKLAGQMAERLLRQRLDDRVLAYANRTAIEHPPSNAQLSRLRGIIRQELLRETPTTSQLCDFIKELRGSGRRQFDRSRVGGAPLLDWLKKLLNCDSPGAWTMTDGEWNDALGVNSGELNPSIGGMRASLGNELRLEYVLRYIDLVLAHTAKEQWKE